MKKKYLYISAIVLVILLIVSVNLLEPKSGQMLCTYKSSNDAMNVEMSYLITFKDKMVTNLKAKEVIKSNDEKMLSEYKETLDKAKSIMKALRGYYEQ